MIFKQDDKVRCVNLDDEWVRKSGCEIGSTYVVEECNCAHSLRLNGQAFSLQTSSFELCEEDSFEIGSRVECVNLDDDYANIAKCKIGHIYTVKETGCGTNVMLKESRVNYWISRKCFKLVTESIKKSSNLTFDRDGVNWDGFSEWAKEAIQMAEKGLIPASDRELFEREAESRYIEMSELSEDKLYERKMEFLEGVNRCKFGDNYTTYYDFVSNVIDKYLNRGN